MHAHATFSLINLIESGTNTGVRTSEGFLKMLEIRHKLAGKKIDFGIVGILGTSSPTCRYSFLTQVYLYHGTMQAPQMNRLSIFFVPVYHAMAPVSLSEIMGTISKTVSSCRGATANFDASALLCANVNLYEGGILCGSCRDFRPCRVNRDTVVEGLFCIFTGRSVEIFR